MIAGFKLPVLTVDGLIEVQLPCNLDDDMNIVIENKGVPYPEGRGIHHVRLRCSPAACLGDCPGTVIHKRKVLAMLNINFHLSACVVDGPGSNHT